MSLLEREEEGRERGREGENNLEVQSSLSEAFEFDTVRGLIYTEIERGFRHLDEQYLIYPFFAPSNYGCPVSSPSILALEQTV